MIAVAGPSTVLITCEDPECPYHEIVEAVDTPAGFAVRVATDGLDALARHRLKRHGGIVAAEDPASLYDLRIGGVIIPRLSAGQVEREVMVLPPGTGFDWRRHRHGVRGRAGAVIDEVLWEPSHHDDEPRDQHAFLGNGLTAGVGPNSDDTWGWTVSLLENGDDVAQGRSSGEAEAKAAAEAAAADHLAGPDSHG